MRSWPLTNSDVGTFYCLAKCYRWYRESAPSRTHYQLLVTNKGHTVHHMTLRNTHVSPRFLWSAWTLCVSYPIEKVEEEAWWKRWQENSEWLSAKGKVEFGESLHSTSKLRLQKNIEEGVWIPVVAAFCGNIVVAARWRKKKKSLNWLERNFFSSSLNDCILPIT